MPMLARESQTPPRRRSSRPDPKGTAHTSKGSGGSHPSGLSQARWDWPFKTDNELSVAARWFQRQARAQRGQGDDALF